MTAPLSNLPAPSGLAYFLDVDGTLVEIADRPELVSAKAGVTETLQRLHDATGGALALVSGRAISDIDCIMRPLHLPAAGLHGLERRRADGRVDREIEELPHHGRLLARLEAMAEAWPGCLVEDKGLTIAFHFRQRPDVQNEATAAIGDLVASATELKVQAGKMVLEIKPRGADKGSVVAHLMSEAPFAGRRPFFAGDDVTDEDAFGTVGPAGGITVKVGRDERPTAADWSVDSVDELIAWLDAQVDVERQRIDG